MTERIEQTDHGFTCKITCDAPGCEYGWASSGPSRWFAQHRCRSMAYQLCWRRHVNGNDYCAEHAIAEGLVHPGAVL